MPVTDRREPGVYVTIEDASYVSSTTEVGRQTYVVGLCDRGPHNQIVTVTSQADFQHKFGKPDFNRTTQSHYIADKALEMGGTLLYVRVVPDDAKIANVSIKTNSSPNTVIGVNGDEFTFTELTLTVPVESNYSDADAYKAAVAAYDAAYLAARKVTVDSSVFDNFIEGQWLFANEDTANGIAADSSADARQIVSRDAATNTYTLDAPYAGGVSGWGTKECTVTKYIPFITESSSSMAWDTKYTVAADLPDQTNTVYSFQATGTGEYYNSLKIKGTRNTELEKMYVDEDGNPSYKYMFMNLGVYMQQEDGTDKLMEGPWTVSLIKNNPEGAIVRDLSSGDVLYIQEVINTNSELVTCIAGDAVAAELARPNNTLNNAICERNRYQVMLLMSVGQPVGTSAYVPTGNSLIFENGEDGTTNGQPIYNSAGKLYTDSEINGLITQAYDGSLTSYDGSVEQITECTYPWYEPDYINTGGFSPAIQNAGRALADYRQDCFHIGDTGNKKSVSQDLTARLEEVPWNNWTSQLYVQYRKITDKYTGEQMWITPAYHAMERHLAVDALYFIGEPVAGIEKGAISDPIQLAYRTNHAERGDLQDAELNMTIVEPQGKYFLTQLTTWKRLSILKRAHAAKFVCYCRKMIPTLLKDLLQRKATTYWINQAQTRVEYFLRKFTNAAVERYQILESYSANVEFDSTASELNVYIELVPLRVIERINVFITVE